MRKVNYKPKNCLRCEKEFKPNSGFQIYCSECGKIVYKEEIKQWYLNHRVLKGFISKICKRCEKEFKPRANGQIYCEECRDSVYKEYKKQYRRIYPEKRKQESDRYYTKHKEEIKERVRTYEKTPKGKEVMFKHHYNRKRQLGFIPLNDYVEGRIRHHVNKEEVIYMNREDHEGISHCLKNGRNMEKINALAYRQLAEDFYKLYIGGEYR